MQVTVLKDVEPKAVLVGPTTAGQMVIAVKDKIELSMLQEVDSSMIYMMICSKRGFNLD